MSTSDDSDRDVDGLWTNETVLCARALLADRRALAVVAVVCLLCLGGWLTYAAYAAPDETTEQRTTETWTMTGTISHGATVVEPTTVYGDDGGVEVTDEPVYYRSVSPTANGAVAVEYDTAKASDVDLEIDLEVVSRAVDDGTVYWDVSEPLDRVERENVEPGETVAASFELEVSRIEERIDEIESELGASPGDTETYVDATVSLDGTIEGEQVSTTRQQRMDLSIDESTYSFDGDGSFTEEGTDTETITVTDSSDLIYTAGGPLLFVLGVVGGGIVVTVTRRPLSEAERQWISYRDAREEYDTVIVRANLPATVDPPFIEIPTLEELATLAIDFDSAVLEVRASQRYVVHHRNRTYVYDPPQEPWDRPEPDSDTIAGSDTDTALSERALPEPNSDPVDDP
ncbi:uncharacterized protein Nmag_4174 (plasmid) [Natrialba magadii ATCC 43099]|uniref:DUF5305 domain-containing protein n=1 Tax=Natrialba magadii (strain ATCC 43099 / DSM 3394 / CCM 3739 / CIP 104546 / IAM 13178 / JCM 8861 / NBRC 102185 / NCIMB 2190 / MS3) TaxID=547559 RepID=D3T278_NATMM|nr:DUF5305 domain-containing protein [Natrialba magadii]ADD07687.1 uncharacterized protein Nmag_4174 [Natrialba magadii ATCC 43099]ELY26496.1 hypothetical protein C500_15075 [Natrialba magadii ATCC 43099]